MSQQTRGLDEDANVSSLRIPMPPKDPSLLSSGSAMMKEPVLRQLTLNTLLETLPHLGRKWSEANEATKAKYEAMAEKDKARYERENNAYKKKLKGGDGAGGSHGLDDDDDDEDDDE